MLNKDQNKRPFILNQLVRATTEEALEGTNEVKLITPATAKVIAGTGGRNVFRSGGTPGSFTATIDTNSFTIDNMSNSKDVDLVFNNLLLVGGGIDYQIDKATGIVTLEFPIKTGETIHYDVFSTSYSYNDLVDLPKDIVNPAYVDGKIAELVGSAPETLDTLKELGDALGNDPNFATTVSTKLGELTTKDTDLTKQITDCNEELGKVKEQIDNIDVSWDEISGKPTQFSPSTHTHDYSPSGHNHSGVYAPNVHKHTVGDITGITYPVTSVAGKTGAVSLTKGDVGLGNVDNTKQMPSAGGTFTGVAIAQTNTSYTTRQLRNTIISTANPSGGGNGDVWFKYS